MTDYDEIKNLRHLVIRLNVLAYKASNDQWSRKDIATAIEDLAKEYENILQDMMNAKEMPQ